MKQQFALSLFEAITANDIKEVAASIVADAKAGDDKARRLLFAITMPKDQPAPAEASGDGLKALAKSIDNIAEVAQDLIDDSRIARHEKQIREDGLRKLIGKTVLNGDGGYDDD